jgi:hypothetical protein
MVMARLALEVATVANLPEKIKIRAVSPLLANILTYLAPAKGTNGLSGKFAAAQGLSPANALKKRSAAD